MYINVDLEEGSTSCAIDFTQSDVENMWNYLKEDRENFEYNTIQYFNCNFDNYKEDWLYNEDLKSLYKKLKDLYEDI